MRYKLNIELSNAVGYIDPPMFDSLLTKLWIEQNAPMTPTPLILDEKNIIDLPRGWLVERDGYYLASLLQVEREQDVEFTSNITKRFDVKHAHRARFKNARKFQNNKGAYKSYQIPVLLHGVQHAWFIFESENIDWIKDLLKKRLFAIGKKRNRGWGLVKNWTIEESAAPITRFVPFELAKIPEDSNAPIIYLRRKPPYWSFDNAEPCVKIDL